MTIKKIVKEGLLMSSSVDIEYPSLADALYQAHNLDEARKLYVEMLRSTGNIFHAQYAAKLEQSRRMLSADNLKQLENDFIEFKEHIKSWTKDSKIQVSLFRRQKDFLGLNSKIRLYLAQGKNLSKINDLLGFRIVLKTDCPDSEETIKQCYSVLNETISFFALKMGCMLIEAEPRSGNEISKEEAKELGIVIPTKNLILDGFENNVKDYVAHPKTNGYQSLHFLVSTPTDLIFEVQVRSTHMDILAEYGSGEHDKYKASKYESTDLGDIDFSQINMPGFMALSSGELYDKIGLQTSVDPFNILY